jgi:DNA repair protein RadC
VRPDPTGSIRGCIELASLPLTRTPVDRGIVSPQTRHVLETSSEYPLPNRLRETAIAERPQERLEKFGAPSLSDTELLAMLLRSGTRGQDVLTLANRLVSEAGSLAGLIAWRTQDFQKLKGIGRVKALQLVTVMEVARRVVGQQVGEAPLLNRADLITAYLQPIAAGLEVEKFWVLCLNRKNRLVKRVEITSGTATAALAHPREVFRAAIREAASAVVCAHNHPSGDPAPSAPDLHATRQIREAARAVDIDLLDHVIIGRAAADPLGRGYFSFREAGLL